MTNNSGRRSHPYSANHSSSLHGTPPTPPVIIPGPLQLSTPYITRPFSNHQHRYIRSDQNNSYGLQQVPPVEKDCKLSYEIF